MGDDSFGPLMERLRAGDGDAATAVFRRFVHRLIGLARSQFDTWIRDRADPEDVVQSVYKSFFLRCDQGQFELVGWNELWSLLALITVRKCASRIEYFSAARRDAARDTPLTSDPTTVPALFDREPTPPEAVMLAETVEHLLRGLDPTEQEIIQRTLQGYTVPEIARALRRSERTIWRVRHRARLRLSRLTEQVGEGPQRSPAEQPDAPTSP